MPSEVNIGRELADPEWDKFVEAAPGGTYQQSSMWAQVKSAAGWRPVRIRLTGEDGAVAAGCQVLVRRVGRFGSVAYVPHGPLVPDGDGTALATVLDALRQLARQERMLYLKLQPPPHSADMTDVLRRRRFVPGGLEPAPRMTVLVDLSRSPEEIMGAMRSRTRTYIRQAQRRGVVVREAGEEDLPVFCALVDATAHRKGLRPYPLGYYQTMWRSFPDRMRLLLAEYKGDILSGTLLLAFGDTVSYKNGGWSGDRRDVRPNELLHWTGMQWGKDRGYRYYDLEGLLPAVGEAILAGRDYADLEMPGIAHFKLGLGGEVTRFPGCYDYTSQPLLRLALPLVAPRVERLTPIAHRLLGRRKSTSETLS